MPAFSSDSALTDPLQDRLGYAPFAKLLADSIEKMTPSRGIVIAIYGEWGSGKTTVLGFIKSYLATSTSQTAPVIITFNPWWYTGSEALLVGFFSTLEEELNTRHQKWIKGVGVNFRKLSHVLAKIPVDAAGIPEVAFEEFGTGSIETARNKIIKQLERLNKRIVITIDDVDRLTPTEMKQLFTVIKAVADFPNIVYLLVFDEKVVTHALDKDYGFDYLEKIIQVPFRLPVASKEKLQAWLLDGLQEILGTIPPELEDRFFHLRGYLTAISNIVDTPRRIIRLLNTFRVTYAGLREEVHSLDFLFLEVVRVFYPDLYQYIADNSAFFAGDSISSDDLKLYEALITSITKNRHDVDVLLKGMFPKLATIVPISGRNLDGDAKARRELRIRSRTRFSIYFGLALRDEQATQSDLTEIMSLLEQSSTFADRLIAYSKIAPIKFPSLLDNIFDCSYIMSKEQTLSLIDALLSAADQIIERPENEGSLTRTSKNVLRNLCFFLFQRLKSLNHTDTIIPIFTNTPSLMFALDLLAEINHMGGELPPTGVDSASFQMFTSDEIQQLNEIAFAKLRELRNTSKAIDLCAMNELISKWLTVRPDEARAWLIDVLTNPDNLLILLECFWNRTRVGSPKNPIVKELANFIRIEDAVPMLESHLRQGAFEGQRKEFAEQWLTAAHSE